MESIPTNSETESAHLIGSNSSSSVSELVARAETASENLKAENKRMEENIRRLELLKTQGILGGETDSGEQVKSQEETPAEYAKRVMRGGFK